MPIYEFKCNSCDSEFQDLFASSDFDVTEIVCENCGEKNVERLLSVFASEVKSASSAAPCGPHCACHPA